MNIQQQLAELRETLHGQPSASAYGRVRDLVLAIEGWDSVEVAVDYVSKALEVQRGWGRYLERWKVPPGRGWWEVLTDWGRYRLEGW